MTVLINGCIPIQCGWLGDNLDTPADRAECTGRHDAHPDATRANRPIQALPKMIILDRTVLRQADEHA